MTEGKFNTGFGQGTSASAVRVVTYEGATSQCARENN